MIAKTCRENSSLCRGKPLEVIRACLMNKFVPSLEETSRQNARLPWYHLRGYKEASKLLVSPNVIAESIIFLNLLKNNEGQIQCVAFCFSNQTPVMG